MNRNTQQQILSILFIIQPVYTHNRDCNKIAKGTSFILSVYMVQIKFNFLTRKNEGTQREAQGVGRDMSCPRKLFLDERKSLF